MQQRQQKPEVKLSDILDEPLAHSFDAAHQAIAPVVQLLNVHGFPVQLMRKADYAAHRWNGRIPWREEHLPFVAQSLVIQPEHVLSGLLERLPVSFSYIDRE